MKVTTETEKRGFLPGNGDVLFIPASSYNLGSPFMNHKPFSNEEKDLYSFLESILSKKSNDFTVLGCTEINAIGKSKSWLTRELHHINRKARFADYNDYLLILAYHLNELIREGFSVKEAWHIITTKDFLNFFTNTPFLYLNSDIYGYMIVGGFTDNPAKNPWATAQVPYIKSQNHFSYCGHIPLVVK